VRDLSNDDYDVRKAAAERLLQAGPAAADAVARAADSDDIELPRRCVELLGRMLHSGDEKTEAAAGAALKRLTKSDRDFLAKSASQTLEGPAPQVGPAGPIRAVGPRAQIQVGGIVLKGGHISISRRVTNGKQQTEVKTDEQTIRIQDDNGKDIHIEITQTAPDADGNPATETKEYRAKDLAELREKDPDTAKIYERFGGGRFGAVRIGAKIGGRAVARPVAPAAQKKALQQQVEQLGQTIKRYEQRVKDGQMTKEQLERIQDVLQRHQELLKKQIERIEQSEDAAKKAGERGA
jgi:hypothetical protein